MSPLASEGDKITRNETVALFQEETLAGWGSTSDWCSERTPVLSGLVVYTAVLLNMGGDR